MDKIGQELLEDFKPVKLAPGMNVRHISRVTGYYAWTEGWNPGKRQELIDRHRETDNKPLVYFHWYNG